MLSVLAQRSASRTPAFFATSIARSRAPLFASPTVTRTFLTTPRLAYPPATKTATGAKAASGAKKPAAKKPAAKRPAAKKSSTKKTATKKPRAAAKPKAPEKITILPSDKPPKRPEHPYLLFWKEYRARAVANSTSLAETSAHAKVCGQEWMAMSEQQKQPYFDEYAKQKELHAAAMQEFWKNIEPKKLKELNKRLLARGKRRVVRHQQRATAPYLRYLKEHMPDFLKTYKNESGGTPLVAASRAISAGWRALTPGQKAVYQDAYEQEKAALQKASASS